MRRMLTSNSTPGWLRSGKGPHTRRSGRREEGEMARTASTSARIPSTPALSLSPVSLAPRHWDASPSKQAGCAALAGTATCKSSLRGSASRKAMSSLERLPQAQQRSAAAIRVSEPKRIVDSQGQLGETEGLVLVHVVEEIVHPSARDRAPAVREPPTERERDARGEGEEVLRGQVAAAHEGARQVEKGEPRSDRGGQRVGEVEVAPERRAAGQLVEAQRDGVHVREPQRGGPASHREVHSPGELVTQIVARRELDAGEAGRREQPVARRRIEEELIAAGAEDGPARARGALLRIVLELAPGETRVRHLDEVVRDLHVADQHRVLEPLLDDVAAGREREAARGSGRLGHLGDRAALSVEDDVQAFVGGAEDEAAPRRRKLGEHHVAGASQV